MVIKKEYESAIGFEEIDVTETFRDANEPTTNGNLYYKIKPLFVGDKEYNAVNLFTGGVRSFDILDGVYPVDSYLTTKN